MVRQKSNADVRRSLNSMWDIDTFLRGKAGSLFRSNVFLNKTVLNISIIFPDIFSQRKLIFCDNLQLYIQMNSNRNWVQEQTCKRESLMLGRVFQLMLVLLMDNLSRISPELANLFESPTVSVSHIVEYWLGQKVYQSKT